MKRIFFFSILILIPFFVYAQTYTIRDTLETTLKDDSINNNMIIDSTLTLSKMTTATVNYIGSGGSVTNNPDDVTLENKGGSNIGIHDNYIDSINVAYMRADTFNTYYNKFNIKKYGAVGDSSTDDTQAFIDAINAIGADGYLYIPAGSYRITSEIDTFQYSIRIVGEGEDVTKIYPDCERAFHITADSTGATTTLSDTALIGQNYFVVSNADGFTIGNIISVLSDRLWYWDDRGQFYAGETQKIADIREGGSLDTLFIEGKVWDIYDPVSNTITVSEFTNLEIKIENLSIIFGETDIGRKGIVIENCVDVKISDIEIYNAASIGIRFKNCFNASVKGCTIDGTNDRDAGYSIEFESVTNFAAIDNYFARFRAGIDISGIHLYAGPSRNGIIALNRFASGGYQRPDSLSLFNEARAITCHSPAEHILICNNIFNGHGIAFAQLRGSSIKVSDNKMTGYLVYGITFNHGANLEIINNTFDPVYCERNTLGNTEMLIDTLMTHFVYISDSTYSDSATYVAVEGNKVHALNNSFVWCDTSIANLTICDNKVWYSNTNDENSYWLTADESETFDKCNIMNNDHFNECDGEFRIYHTNCTLTNHRIIQVDENGNLIIDGMSNVEFANDSSVTINGRVTSYAYAGRADTLSADNNDYDVSDISTLFIDNSGGHVTLGGLKNGVSGQVLYIAVIDSNGNNFVMEDFEGAGTQDILTRDGNDIIISIEGGAVLVCDGTAWRVISCSEY